jgi:aldose 1-epimerase
MLLLKYGDYSASIEPEKGGLVSSLCWRDVDLLYSPHSRPQSPNGIHLYGCWPLVPFANRAFDGMLRFNGKDIQLPLNDTNSTMHGFGWQNAWKIEAQTPSSIIMTHESGSGFAPYNYRATQTIELNEQGAIFSLEVQNMGDAALPYGIGFHPWFNCNDRTRLSAKADARMELGAGYRPIGRTALDEGSDFSKAKLVQTGREVAINYLGWDGVANLDYPDSHSIMIEASDTLRAPVFWTPVNADFACFEPQSHASGAVSELAAQIHAPLTMLKPNETLKGWMKIGAAHATDI